MVGECILRLLVVDLLSHLVFCQICHGRTLHPQPKVRRARRPVDTIKSLACDIATVHTWVNADRLRINTSVGVCKIVSTIAIEAHFEDATIALHSGDTLLKRERSAGVAGVDLHDLCSQGLCDRRALDIRP